MEYRVTWIIDLEADSPLDAARIAKRIQSREFPMPSTFHVTDENGYTQEIDV